MTLARVRNQARRWARVHNQWTSGDGVIDDPHVNELIQDAVTQFVNDARGIDMEEYLAISAEFTTRTTMGIHVLVEDSDGSDLVDADVALTATNRDAVSGTTVASDLQTQLRAASGATGTETVTWTEFYFTINFQQGTTFTITAPDDVTLADVSDKIGLDGFSTSSTTITGGFPEDCTVTAALPGDAMIIHSVEWDGEPLVAMEREWAQSPEASGDPAYYHVRGRQMYLYPAPDSQDDLHVWYRGQPADIDFDTDVSLPTEIPSMYQMGVVHHVASALLDEIYEEKRSVYHLNKYRQYVSNFVTNRANNNTEINANRGGPIRVPKVNFS